MTAKNDLSDNPFVSLFGSEDRVKLFHASLKQGNDAGLGLILSCDERTEQEVRDEGGVVVECAGLTVDEINIETNRLLEDVLLVTLVHPGKHRTERTSRFVYIGDSSTADENIIKPENLEQVVCDRLMCDDVTRRVIGWEGSSRTISSYEEADAVAYLAASLCRLKSIIQGNMKQNSPSKLREEYLRSEHYENVLSKCSHTIISQSRLCFLNSDVFPLCQPAQQFMRLLSNRAATLEEIEWLLEYFESVSNSIDQNSEEGSVLEAFSPVLDILYTKLINITVEDPELWSLIDLTKFFTRTKPLARVFLSHIDVRRRGVNVVGQEYEKTILGAMLSVSCLPKSPLTPPAFFDTPSRLSQSQIDNVESFVQPILKRLADNIYDIIYALLKHGADIKHSMLNWLGFCLHANSGRGKLWSHQMDAQMFRSLYCSDSFSLNLCSVLLRLCRPFITRHPHDSSLRLLRKVQCSYCVAASGSMEQSNVRNVHMMELKETGLIPPLSITDVSAANESSSQVAAANESLSQAAAANQSSSQAAAANEKLVEGEYSFTTECLFMTHYALRIGFRSLHDKFLKLNQDLHRMRGLYEELQSQAAASSDTSQRLKDDMDRVMSLYLCEKCALTEPTLLNLSFQFYVATATYLVDFVAERNHGDDTEPAQSFRIATPAQHVQQKLRVVPEFLVENLQDFMLFVKRFKDGLYEEHGDELSPLLTLILVFMGNSEYMRNPHLRAGMAEALEALLPPQSSQQITSYVSHYEREKLFSTHALVSNLSVSLISVFVSIEMTGQGVQFEHKFKYRQPMYIALKYLWKIDTHRDIIKELAVEAEVHSEDTEAPLFLRFINLLINDAIYLLDEALASMSQIKEKQAERERGDWSRLDARQRQEAESSYRHLSMLARFHNMMANETISALEMITRDIQHIFTMSCMVERITAMLNYFLLHLVGPNKRNLRVQRQEEFEFRPRELVSNITRIYMNLGSETESEEQGEDGERGVSDWLLFCKAVAQDSRSYSYDLLMKAEQVLVKIGSAPADVARWNSVALRIKDCETEQAAEDELLSEVPEDFLDPIMGSLMRDPVLLPSSGKIVDRSTISRHILSDQFDPFNRQPLTMDMVKPAEDLRQQIRDWLEQRKLRPTSSSSTNHSEQTHSPDKSQEDVDEFDC